MLSFDGFIDLPRAKVLNVMDYVSIYGNNLFVTSESSGEVYRARLGATDPAQVDVQTLAGDGEAHGVVLDPDSGKAFVTRSVSDHVDPFDPETLQGSGHIPVADDPDGIIYLATEKLLYAVSGGTMTVSLIDPRQQKPVASIALGGKPEFAVYDAETHLVYQNLTDTNEIVVIDPTAKTVVSRWHLDACQQPTGIALDASARRLFVVCAGNNRFVALDIRGGRPITSLPVGRGPDAIAFDATLHRLYVAGRGGELNVIQQRDPDSYSNAETVRTHYGAHTLAIDPATHKVYVAYASLLVKPRLAVFSPVR